MIFDAPPTPPSIPTYECLIEESIKQKIPPLLILAVMMTENGKPGELVKASKNSFDMGPMQINTIWLPALQKKFNWTPRDLMTAITNHGCSNIATGTWILRISINAAKGDVWQGVGYYNTGINYKPKSFPNRASIYANKVYGNYLKIQHLQSALAQKVAANNN